MSTLTPARRRLPTRLAPRVTLGRLAALLGAGVLVFGAWVYVRSSSLVAIRQVQITGVAGADAGAIRTALRNRVVTMTTMDVSSSQLASALAGYPHIAGVRVFTHFPHGVTIAVDERTPVATLTVDGSSVAVDGAGRLLGPAASQRLPSLPIAPQPQGGRVTTPGTLATLSVLEAAPYQLMPHMLSARSTLRHGVTVQLRNGPDLYFGDTRQLRAKWSSATAVLADANSAGAGYIDVSAPERPAAGATSGSG